MQNKSCKSFFPSESGQALCEFAIAFPLQLLLIFGIMELSFLYMSSLLVNFTAYRCARAAIVGEHLEQVDALRTGVDVVAQTLLAPVAGRSLGAGDPKPDKVNIPGWGELNKSDFAAAKVLVRITEPAGGAAGEVTALVEYNQELVFPFMDGLFRLFMRGDKTVYADGEEPRSFFGQEDTGYQGLGSGDYIEAGSNRGRIRIIGGRTHFVITRSCTLYRADALE